MCVIWLLAAGGIVFEIQAQIRAFAWMPRGRVRRRHTVARTALDVLYKAAPLSFIFCEHYARGV